jgi:Flp pilus assembly protein TadG
MVAQVVTNASREGARYAAQGGANTTVVGDYVRDILAKAGLSKTEVGTNSAVAVTIETQAGATWSTTANPSTATYGTPIRVTVSVKFESQSWLPSRFFVGNNAAVQGVTVMRRE